MSRSCVICGTIGTIRWTLDNGEVAVVADVCATHGAPLDAVVAAAGTAPPAPDEPLYVRQAKAQGVPQRQPKKRSLRPLQWTPPAPMLLGLSYCMMFISELPGFESIG